MVTRWPLRTSSAAMGKARERAVPLGSQAKPQTMTTFFLPLIGCTHGVRQGRTSLQQDLAEQFDQTRAPTLKRKV
jgi:hypothetical protein